VDLSTWKKCDFHRAEVEVNIRL